MQAWCVDNIIGPPFLAGNNNWTGSNIFSGTTTFNAAVILSAGGTFSGAIGGAPTFTGNVVFNGSPLFTGSPNFSASTPVWPTAAQPNLNPEIQSIVIANNIGGTTLNSIAKLTGSPSTAITPVVADTVGAVGIVIAGAGTVGNATIQNVGIANCNFDAATTAGDYVVFSATVAGDCHDVPGGGYPSSGQAMGRTLSTNAVAGLYQLNLFASEDRVSGAAGAALPTVVYSVPSASTNANIVATTMTTVGGSSADYRFSWYMSVSAAGAGCGGSTTTVNMTITWTDPLGGGATLTSNNGGAATLLTTGNGVAGVAQSWNGNMSPGVVMFTFRAKTATVIQYATTYTIGAGCAPGPSYQVFPVLEQLTSQ